MFCVSRSLSLVRSRALHTTASRFAVTKLTMPALSPTMTEGTISEWKVKEGESFVAGDILLSMETDKASIDVEAQDDGVMGKIVIPNGTSGVEVGKLIALLAEEGDDISSLDVPTESSSPPPAPAASTPAATSPPPAATPKPSAPSPPSPPPSSHVHPTHSQPLLPSVMRQLVLGNVQDPSVIKPTGHKGMLTKGDVLAYLGKISNPRGSEKAEAPHSAPAAAAPAAVQEKKLEPLSAGAMRQLIAFGLAAPAPKSINVAPLDFDSVLAQYLPSIPKRATSAPPPSSPQPARDPFDALLGL